MGIHMKKKGGRYVENPHQWWKKPLLYSLINMVPSGNYVNNNNNNYNNSLTHGTPQNIPQMATLPLELKHNHTARRRLKKQDYEFKD